MQAFHEQVKTDYALPIRFDIYTSGGSELIPSHWHNSLEIIYIQKGSMDITVRDHTTRLMAGDFLIINSREIHSTHCNGITKNFLLQIPYPFLKAHIPSYDFIRFKDLSGPFSFPGDNKIIPILEEMGTHFEDISAKGRLKITSLLYGLLAELVDNYMIHLSENDKAKSDKNFRRLSTLMDYVESQYDEPLSISDAAGLLHLEEAYFCRFFKKYMGQTFLEYVNSVRLRHIYDDMLRTDLPLMEILDKHGFHNYKVFSRLFKETYGMTPRQKRAEYNR